MFVDVLKATNGDGIQVECVLGNEDENGVVTYGYEDRTVSEFRAKFGKNPFELPNNDPEWMQFRADYTTLFLSELRERIKLASPDTVLSTTIIAGEKDDYIKVLQDWPAWIEKGLLDEFYIWFRTDSDLRAPATGSPRRGCRCRPCPSHRRTVVLSPRQFSGSRIDGHRWESRGG